MKEMTVYVCLDCGHKLNARRASEYLAKPRQCGNCWGYNLVTLEDYDRCKQRAKEEYERYKRRAEELIATTPFGIFPLWDVVRAVWEERGLTLTPAKTVALCGKLYRDILSESG